MSEWGRLQDSLHEHFDEQGVAGVDVDKLIEHIVSVRDFFPGLLARAASRERPQPPLHGHNYGGDWIECTDEHLASQERPQPHEHNWTASTQPGAWPNERRGSTAPRRDCDEPTDGR